jgi:tRNA dimethylallyltransferase
MASSSQLRSLALIAGPTASGKSALALALAQAVGGEIVNADALQLYAPLRILSNRPSEAELAAVPHHLVGVLDGSTAASTAWWLAQATAAITGIWARGKPAVVVGGTGLYFKALLEGLSEIPPIPLAIREAVRALDALALRAALEAEDPAMAARLNANDRQRRARALEVVRATGHSLLGWQQAGRAGALTADPMVKLALLPGRDALYARCDARFDAMMSAGAAEEVAALMALKLDPALPVMKAVGVRELAAAQRGALALPLAIEAAQRETRRYAKRQYTWLRNQFGDWDTSESYENTDLVNELARKLRK